MNRKIKNYDAAWNPNLNVGFLRIYYTNGGQPSVLKDLNAQEFTAILTILQGESTAYVNEKGWIVTSETEQF